MTDPWQRKEIIGDCTLYLGDCREVMPTIGKVDAVVADPPYGVNYQGSKRKDGSKGFGYASFEDTPENIARVCVPAIRIAISMASCGVITPGNANSHLYDAPRTQGAIFYPCGANLGPWGFSCSQPLFYYGKDPYLSHGLGSMPNGFSTSESSDRTIEHPCPKPEGVVKWLVRRVSFDGHTILDPFMGSGTTGVACVKLGRRFIGIEIEPKYFDIACKRIDAATREPRLPLNDPPNLKQTDMLEDIEE